MNCLSDQLIVWWTDCFTNCLFGYLSDGMSVLFVFIWWFIFMMYCITSVWWSAWWYVCLTICLSDGISVWWSVCLTELCLKLISFSYEASETRRVLREFFKQEESQEIYNVAAVQNTAVQNTTSANSGGNRNQKPVNDLTQRQEEPTTLPVSVISFFKQRSCFYILVWTQVSLYISNVQLFSSLIGV